MLARENRLKKEKDFESIFKNGRGFKQGLVYLKIKKNNLETIRFGFIVSKKISGKAVARNRIKRKLREIVRKEISGLKNGWDIAVVVDQNPEDNFLRLKSDLGKAFSRAGFKK